MADISGIITERQKTYGHFGLGMALEVQMLDAIKQNYRAHNKAHMTSIHEHFIARILLKLSRLSVSPTHLDSWKDIEGYARLIHDHIKECQHAKKR